MPPAPAEHDTIHHADNLDVLPLLPDGAFQLVYIDPPFNTGEIQSRRLLETTPHADGDRVGFQGRRYRTRLLAESRYRDSFEDYLAFLEPRLRHVHRLLHPTGTLYFHIDYREAHYCKLLLDELFGREQFLNELIWAYDYGARTRRRWPAKHDTILVYVKDVDAYFFDGEAVDREPYMAPGLVDRREGGAREAADRRLVAHDRPHERPREDRLSDAEAGGDRAPDGAGFDQTGRLVPRLLRRQRDARRRRHAARAPLRADRREPRRGRGHAQTAAGGRRRLRPRPARRRRHATEARGRAAVTPTGCATAPV